MSYRRLVLLLAPLAFAACDVVVNDGETVVAGNGGSISGFERDHAVTVLPGGTLIVQDATLSGEGRLVDAVPPGVFPTPGSGILSDGGVVRVEGGEVRGGNVVVALGRDPNALAALPRAAFASTLGSALRATRSRVEISGGSLVPSGVVGTLDPYGEQETVAVSDSDLRIRGGTFFGASRARAGQPGAPPFEFPVFVRAVSSRVEISGGRFEGLGRVRLISSLSRISGGELPITVILGDQLGTFNLPGGCTEIHGGRFTFVGVFGAGERLFVFADRFVNLTPGPVPIPAAPGPRTTLQITAVPPRGPTFNVSLDAEAGTQVVLARTGDPGCEP